MTTDLQMASDLADRAIGAIIGAAVADAAGKITWWDRGAFNTHSIILEVEKA